MACATKGIKVRPWLSIRVTGYGLWATEKLPYFIGHAWTAEAAPPAKEEMSRGPEVVAGTGMAGLGPRQTEHRAKRLFGPLREQGSQSQALIRGWAGECRGRSGMNL